MIPLEREVTLGSHLQKWVSARGSLSQGIIPVLPKK